MIDIFCSKITGFEDAIRGMRNPMNSWDKSDSFFCKEPNDECSVCEARHTDQCCDGYVIGLNDHKLMLNLAKNGSVHAKYRRMIWAWCDITAPLYWWKEFETYRVGVIPNPFDIEMNSCSTMHKIHEKEFTRDDFSVEHLINTPLKEKIPGNPDLLNMQASNMMEITIGVLNAARYNYLKTKDKKYWYAIIQLLPSSYNQKRTLMLNYEALAHMYKDRKDHKLDEWRNFCKWIEELPYSELITLKENNEMEDK